MLRQSTREQSNSFLTLLTRDKFLQRRGREKFLPFSFAIFRHYITIDKQGVEIMVMFESLSRALDAFNANRVEDEQMEWHELVADINNPLDEREVMRLIIDLYEDAV
jgi:hypothetical protein